MKHINSHTTQRIQAGPQLDPRPFQRWAAARLARLEELHRARLRYEHCLSAGADTDAVDPNHSLGPIAQLAAELGVEERAARRLVFEHATRISERFVDRMLCHAGHPHLLNELYPLELDGSEQIAA